jgi:ferredoxin/flavodoxin---NADP+ reductase
MKKKNNLEKQLGSQIYEVLDIQFLSESTFILFFPKCRFEFLPGQHVNISIMGEQIGREYSIYSSPNDDFLKILVKEVEDGFLTPKLKFLKKGDIVKIQGPRGRFYFNSRNKDTHKHVFISSGTGIAPLHSMIKSYSGIDYMVIQGVRHVSEECERNEYEKGKFILCTSRDNKGDFSGRLTEYLKQIDFDENTCFYLCGNNEMIYDAKEIIHDKGFDNENIHTEVYF